MLISAFGRGTQDPFGPSRQASLYALHHSERFFTLKDIATKILPVVCHATIDPELDVRQQVGQISERNIRQFLAFLPSIGI